jgi:hypothetical protein
MKINELLEMNRVIDDESNLWYRYDPDVGRLKERMIDNRDEYEAKRAGYRPSIEDALKVHGIVKSKFHHGKWIQNQGGKWVEVHPFGKPEGVKDDGRKQQFKATGHGGMPPTDDNGNPLEGVAEGSREMTGTNRDRFISRMSPFIDHDTLMRQLGKVVNSPEFNSDTILKIVDAGDKIQHPVGRYIQKEFDELQYDLGRKYEDYPEEVAEKLLDILIHQSRQGVAEGSLNEFVAGGGFKPPKTPTNKNNGPWGDDDDDDDDGFDWSKEPNKLGKKMLELQHKRIKIIWRPWLDQGHDTIAIIKNIRPMAHKPNVIEFTYSWKTSGGKWQKAHSFIGPNAVEDATLVPVGANAYELKELSNSDNFSEGVSEAANAAQQAAIAIAKKKKKGVKESATVGATSAANIGTVVSPQLSPGEARGKKSYTGSIATGSGTKAPPQPKVVQPKNSDGTAKNGLDMKANIMGGPANEAITIKRR